MTLIRLIRKIRCFYRYSCVLTHILVHLDSPHDSLGVQGIPITGTRSPGSPDSESQIHVPIFGTLVKIPKIRPWCRMEGWKDKNANEKVVKNLELLIILSNFAPNNIETMEDKRYPVFEEEEGTGMCCEPAVGYAATGSGYANTVANLEETGLYIPIGKLGFYTEDPDVFEARIAEIEADVERAEQGDESSWLTAEEFDLELREEFPWLR